MRDFNPIQALVDNLNATEQVERRDAGMTLGTLIAALAALPAERSVVGFGDAMSYRGYYCDLAFDPTGIARTVGEVLAECRDAMGREFTGYKGGEFLMGQHTPLWIAEYGSTGARLVGLNTDADLITPITRVEND